MVGDHDRCFGQRGREGGTEMVAYSKQRVLNAVTVDAFWVAGVHDERTVNDEFVAVQALR